MRRARCSRAGGWPPRRWTTWRASPAVSRATAFNYFPSKHLLLAALVHEMESRFLHVMEAQLPGRRAPPTASARCSAGPRARHSETPQLSRVLIGASETTFGAAPDSGVRTARVHRALCACSPRGTSGATFAATADRMLAEIVAAAAPGF